MTKKNGLTNLDGEVRDLSKCAKDTFKHAEDILPETVLEKIAVRDENDSPPKEWLSTHPSVI